MYKLLIALLFTSLSTVSFSTVSFAAATKDDGATLGTAEDPQVVRQQNATDKGPVGVAQDGVPQEASQLGNADTPQLKEQNKHTDIDSAGQPTKRHKNKLLRNKHEKAGTTQGNPVQPTEYESAPPATTR